MASFRTHISFGVALGILSVGAVVSLALVPSGWEYFILVALAVTVGAIAPDIDSDSGVPFHVTFASLSLVAASLALLYAIRHSPGDWTRTVGYPIGAIVVVWGVIGSLFKKFTRHRGMAHSIPAAALSGLLLFAFSSRVGFSPQQAFLLGVAMALGYLLHLVLDEVYAAVNFHGTMFIPNKAFGSALKFTSQSAPVNLCVYGAVAYLFAVNANSLMSLGENLVVALR